MMKRNTFVNLCFGILALMIIIQMVQLGSALDSLGNFEQNQVVVVRQTCADATYIKLSIYYPNSTLAVAADMVDNTNGQFTYDFSSTEIFGRYDVTGTSDGCENTFATYFLIGGESSGGMTTTFIILFMLFLLFVTYWTLYSIGHSVSLDFDIVDLSVNYGLYFIVIAFGYFNNYYIHSSFMKTFCDLGADIGIYTLFVLPTIYFILTLTIGSWQKKKVQGVSL
jgi:hypothetical protein